MIDDIMFEEILGPTRFFVWSKENELWRTFYRTKVAGHWAKEDIEEFNKCGCFYEIHLQHGNDDEAHLFSMMIMQRCDNFKAAKVAKLAVNDMKVIILLGRSADWRHKIARLAKQSNFELVRLRSKADQQSHNEKYTNSKFGEYMNSLRNAFAPTAGKRPISRP